jgi:hypothetical protein
MGFRRKEGKERREEKRKGGWEEKKWLSTTEVLLSV